MTKKLPGITIFRVFEKQQQVETLEIIPASLIVSHMLWAEKKELRNRSLYMTLCFRKIHDLLLATEKEHGKTIFDDLVEMYFGGWQNYSQNLVLTGFPETGKGSIQERAWQGEIAGQVFIHAYRNAVSLNEAAEVVSENIRSSGHAEHMQGMLKPASQNIMRNYWPRFQNVAHFWAAMHYFTMPEPSDSIIRLDKATPHPDFPNLRSGWRGIMDLAHGFLDGSADVKRYKTHKPLLDPEKALRITFT